MEISTKLEELPLLRTAKLRVLWVQLFAKAAHPKLRRDLMIPILAYRIQEKAYGDRQPASRGMACDTQQYNDGSFSGGTMNRPAPKQLLEDIAAGRVDAIVVHKVDYLTRSLTDFAKMVEAFDEKGVSFVSVTQQFSTTSMGRLTLNVLLSFAQFERGSRVKHARDWPNPHAERLLPVAVSQDQALTQEAVGEQVHHHQAGVSGCPLRSRVSDRCAEPI